MSVSLIAGGLSTCQPIVDHRPWLDKVHRARYSSPDSAGPFLTGCPVHGVTGRRVTILTTYKGTR